MIDYSNNYLHPDNWNIGEIITQADDYSDSSFPGCQYRIPAGLPSIGWELAINLTVSGRKSFPLDFGRYKTRVKIEFVGDGEPSNFSHGWIYTDHCIIGV